MNEEETARSDRKTTELVWSVMIQTKPPFSKHTKASGQGDAAIWSQNTFSFACLFSWRKKKRQKKEPHKNSWTSITEGHSHLLLHMALCYELPHCHFLFSYTEITYIEQQCLTLKRTNNHHSEWKRTTYLHFSEHFKALFSHQLPQRIKTFPDLPLQ